MKKRSAEDSDGEEAAECPHGLEALPAFPLPVNIPKIEPQREFIERQSGGYSEDHRAQPGGAPAPISANQE